MQDPLSHALETRVKISRLSKINKLISRPVHFVFAEILEWLSQYRDEGIEIKAKTFWGEPFSVIFPEGVSMYLYRYGFFEEKLTRFMLYYLKPGMTFVDIGSHFGYYSMLAASLVQEQGKVYAFEPTPSTFKMLKKNLGKKINVLLQNSAAFSSNTDIEMQDFGAPFSAYNSMFSGKMNLAEKNRVKQEKFFANAVKFDDFVAIENFKPDLIKIDAEGAELAILQGMDRVLKENKPTVTLEVGDIEGAESLPRSKEVVEYLLAKGYQAWEFHGGKLIQHQITDNYAYDNLIFTPGR